MPWNDCQWRVCVSYQKLKNFTIPFELPIPICDDTVQEIHKKKKYFIAVDMGSGYWQVVV